MPTKKEYQEKILETLKKSSLSIKELTKVVNKELKIVSSDTRSKPFKEAIMDLLRDDKIRLVEYDFSIHNVEEKNKDNKPRIQSDIQIDGIELRCVPKYDKLRLRKVFRGIESDDDQTYDKYEKELQDILKKKFEEYRKLEDEILTEMKKCVVCLPYDEVNLELADTWREVTI